MSWIGVFLGILGAILNVYKHWSCFILWTLANILLINHNVTNRDYAQAFLFVVYQSITTFGLIKWIRETKNGKNSC